MENAALGRVGDDGQNPKRIKLAASDSHWQK